MLCQHTRVPWFGAGLLLPIVGGGLGISKTIGITPFENQLLMFLNFGKHFCSKCTAHMKQFLDRYTKDLSNRPSLLQFCTNGLHLTKQMGKIGCLV